MDLGKNCSVSGGPGADGSEPTTTCKLVIDLPIVCQSHSLPRLCVKSATVYEGAVPALGDNDKR